MENLSDKVERLVQQVMAVQNAQAFAIAALFGELVAADVKRAEHALGMLRMCSTAPMPAEQALKLEELVLQWADQLQPD